MMEAKTLKTYFFILGILLITFFIINLCLGSIAISVTDIIKILLGRFEDGSYNYIVLDYRLPKALTAVIVGSGLGISGLLMQTLFRNPLAGPFVLGISSGASLAWLY